MPGRPAPPCCGGLGPGWWLADGGAHADASERRKWLLTSAEDTLAHASLIGQALSRLGQPVTGSMIRGYAFRGRLTAHGTDRLGRPLYRVGDVIVLTAAP